MYALWTAAVVYSCYCGNFLITLKMPPKKKVTLTDSQKYELCLYANNNKKTQVQYVEWVEQKWGVVVDQTTITRILQSKDKWLSTKVIYPKKNGINLLHFQNLNLLLRSSY